MIKPARPSPVTRQPQGFALVVALFLMAFLVLLLLSLSTLTMVEITGSQRAKYKMHAEQNALLGLQVAIAQLQSTVGPDQRVTAAADILADNTADKPHQQRRFWTGVWNTDPSHPNYASGARIAWLVSGQVNPATAHQSAPNPLDEVRLVGSGSAPANQEVYAPSVTINNGDNTGTNKYAYWVGDEGIKARYNLPISSYNTNAGYNPHAVAPSRPGFATMSAFLNAATKDNNSVANDMPRVTSFQELPLLHNITSPQETFHHFSYHSQGVLTDARNGGLKYDLTTAFEDDTITLPSLGSDLPDLELFRSYYKLKGDVSLDNGRFSIKPRVQTNTQHEVKPILVLFQGNFGVLPSDANGEPAHHPDPVTEPSNLIFTMRPTIVMANPYDVDLEPADYDIIWEPEAGSPDLVLTIGFLNSSNVTTYRSLRPFDLLGGRLQLRIEQEPFLAGEVKVFTLADDGRLYSHGARLENIDEIGRYFWVPSSESIPSFAFKPNPNAPSSPPTLDWDIQTRILFQMQDADNALQPASTRFTVRVNGQDATVHEDIFSGTRKWIGKISSQFINFYEALDYGYHARFLLKPAQRGRNNFPNAGDIAGSGSDARGMPWLANINIRSPRTSNLKDTFQSFTWNSHPAFSWDGHNTGWINDATPLPQGLWNINSSGGGKRTSWASNPVGSESPVANPGGTDFVTLYHTPRAPLLSLGQLKHVNAAPEYAGTYSVGHSWASMFQPFNQQDFHYKLNQAIWDRFFFSGLVNGNWLNPRIQPLDPNSLTNTPNPQQIASFVMVEGSFNINSTSVEAWRAVLASLREQDIQTYHSESAANTIKTETHTDTPFPSSAMPSGSPMPPSLGANAAPNQNQLHAQWNGYRSLTDTQIEILAGQIVHQIRKRGPFLSLGDFVNRDPSNTETGLFSPRMMGALQAAIDNTGAVTVDGKSYAYNPATTINFQAPATFLRLNPRVGITGTSDFPEANKRNPLPNDDAIDGLSAERDAPGYLSQSDILSALGSIIAVRSDTFKIRAYGSWENPLNGAKASAVCEAIVQRLPTPVSPDNNFPNEPDSATKQTLGRQFHIVSFRWLQPNEI